MSTSLRDQVDGADAEFDALRRRYDPRGSTAPTRSRGLGDYDLIAFAQERIKRLDELIAEREAIAVQLDVLKDERDKLLAIHPRDSQAAPASSIVPPNLPLA